MENNNILIAEFIGMQKTNIGWFDSEDSLSLNYTIDNTFDILLFDRSWDWLMAAVNECTQIGFRDQEFDNEIYIKWEEIFDDTGMFLGAHMLETYSAVVQFIKWYNKNKKVVQN